MGVQKCIKKLDNGERCSNPVREGSNYCWVHRFKPGVRVLQQNPSRAALPDRKPVLLGMMKKARALRKKKSGTAAEHKKNSP